MGKHLLLTTDHNLTHPQNGRRLQRLWRQMLVPEGEVENAMAFINDVSIEAGRKVDDYLASLAHPQAEPGVKYTEVGVVVYALKEDNTDASNHEEKPTKGDEE